jgi:hypothetical protein
MLRKPTFRNGPRSITHYNRAFHTSILADILLPYGVWAKCVSFKKVSGAKQEKQKLGNYVREYIWGDAFVDPPKGISESKFINLIDVANSSDDICDDDVPSDVTVVKRRKIHSSSSSSSAIAVTPKNIQLYPNALKLI